LWRQVNLLAFAATVMILAPLGCKQSAILGKPRPSLQLSSPSWSNGEEIPQKFTCDRENVSPTLSWSLPPRETQSFVLTFSDPHPLVGSFSHWVLYDLPSGTRQLAEAIPQEKRLPSGAQQGQNDVGHIGYYGPCPFFGSGGRYIFRLYALDVVLNLPPGATQEEVEAAMRGHILATGSLLALYSRPAKNHG
jgi:Raf kinase inhibitor-like YbhB/YbcL family protein